MLISWNVPSSGSGAPLIQAEAPRAARQALVQGIGPPLAVLRDQLREALRVAGAGIERRHVLETLATGAHEGGAVLDVDFLERFQAVDREARAHQRHLAHPARGHAGRAPCGYRA